MVGNILSAVIWLQSTSFASILPSPADVETHSDHYSLYIGLNRALTCSPDWLEDSLRATYSLAPYQHPSLHSAIISDVTDANTRSKSLALIGLAFSICFTFGFPLDSPSLGAYFASQPLPLASKTATNTRWNVYAFPAAISVGLLLLETVYLAIKLPETKDYKKSQQLEEKPTMGVNEGKVKESVEVRRQRLKKLGRLHGFFLLFFSGVAPVMCTLTTQNV
ncbi:hypothetical protein QFC24_004223 [Naganishia onofrii]|uniref:Uncharacterized protein n=1 Tax=Naganishia onofrii TaxID=1851511 RepID=A0ACC2XJ85_9TREE|nr:hypothetical protein QFC24_004223 [Naganishia onofrii]